MENHLKAATAFTQLLDNKFSILGIRFGLDPLLNLFPVIGDLIGLGLSFYLIWIAYRVHVPQEKIHEMIGNIIFDFVLGLIPVVGEVADVFYRANTKNLAIIKRHSVSVMNGEVVSSSLTPLIYH